MSPIASPMGKKFVPRADQRPSVIILDSWWELEHSVGNMVNELAIIILNSKIPVLESTAVP